MLDIFKKINAFVWGAPALILILGVGIYLTFRTGFAQFRLFPRALRLFGSSFTSNQRGSGDASPYRALCTALAATVGTGNLAGVAGAIAMGGPGAIFWMWLCGFMGMIIKCAEAVLAVRFRTKNDFGEYIGGPMYMICNGIGTKWKPLATIYCFFGVVAAFGVGNATQINAMVGGINSVVSAFGGTQTMGLNFTIGISAGLLVLLLLSGGATRIGKAAERLVPFAACMYILLGVGVLFVRRNNIPAAFVQILQGAFQPKAVTGGAVGTAFIALRIGASRGVFTNEAGMGTASIAHAAADVNHPVSQGLMGIIEVFIDTIVICTMTALVILCSNIPIPYGTDIGVTLTTEAFSSVYGSWVCIPLALILCCFAFATVLGWGLYGVRCAQFLFGDRIWQKFTWISVCTVILGATLNTGTVWLFSETVNGLMAIPNLIAIAWLTPEFVALMKNYKYCVRKSIACR